MKKLVLAAAAAAALGLGACDIVQKDIIDPTAKLFSDPNTQIVINGVKVVAQQLAADAQVAACVISAGTGVAAQIEANPAFNSSASLQGTNMRIYVASTATCQTLQGVLSGSVIAPAGSTVLK